MNKAQFEKQLKKDMTGFINDPYGFVKYNYEWEKGSLKNEPGVDPWQEQVLKDLSHILQKGWVKNQGVKKEDKAGIFISARSGHGIGKTALISWLIQWFMSTHPDCQINVTANKEAQLRLKTWRELKKWHDLSLNKDWFAWTATKYSCVFSPELWSASAITWSERNAQSIAGTHEKYVMILFDEASEIPDIIWETVEGSLTQTNGRVIFVVFGNPTQATGQFCDCFEKNRNRWINYEIDARDSNRVNKALLEQWLEIYGEDSDFFRVRVKGQKPRSGVKQLIPIESVEAAYDKRYHMSAVEHSTKIIGVDIAREGLDRTVLIKRQGIAAFDVKKHAKLDTVVVAELIVKEIKDFKPDMVFLDMGANGSGVYDILKRWGYENKITGVWFSGKSGDEACFNKRTEMWYKTAQWLKEGGCLPKDSELRQELIAPEYYFHGDKYRLEEKKDTKTRLGYSPDIADALVLTFAYPVVRAKDKHIIGKYNKPRQKTLNRVPSWAGRR